MDRINGAGTVDIGGGRRGFRSEDLPTGTEGTEVTDEWLNAIQENILKVIEEAGLALDVNNWSLLWQAIRFSQMADGYFSVTDRSNDPPGAPAVGDRYIVGGVPTGAWVGQEDQIALWLGAWTFIAPTPWMHVGFADRTDWRWDHTLGVPAWVQWKATSTVPGPIALGDTLNLTQILPEIETGANALTVTNNGGGTITVDAGQTWIWRGHRRFSTDQFLLADRTFAIAANKTYHVRWHAPGTGTATPEATYPNGRFELADMTAASPVETDESYDTTYDRMLGSRVVTNGAAVPTFTPLLNKARLKAYSSKLAGTTSLVDTTPYPHMTVTLNWARRPDVSFVSMSAQLTAGKESVAWWTADESSASFSSVSGGSPAVPATRTRYEVKASAGGYYDTNEATSKYTLNAFAITMEA